VTGVLKKFRLPRAEWLIGLTGAGALLLLGWLSVQVITMSHDLRDANQARDLLATQVEQLGGKPVAGPPGSRGEPGQSGVGSAGPQGERGPSGEPGKAAPTITPSPGPSGPAGPAGKDGEDGADSTVPGPSGAAGADSTVAGPPGPTGAPGPQGSAGPAGRDGTDGEDGRPPAEWAFTYKGETYRCTPVTDFDTDAPRYDCQPTEPQPDDPTAEPQTWGLSPFRRQYA
jgi:hypothetical protein